MHNTPYIYLFKTSEGSYCYDVNTNAVIDISDSVYTSLNHWLKGEKVPLECTGDIDELIRMGHLSTKRVENPRHPMATMLPELLSHHLSMIILQVTQRCNLRCEYCVYSGEYKDRIHSQKEMSWELAKKGNRFLL